MGFLKTDVTDDLVVYGKLSAIGDCDYSDYSDYIMKKTMMVKLMMTTTSTLTIANM